MEKSSDSSSDFQVGKGEEIESYHSERNSKNLRVYDAIPCYSEQEAEALKDRLVNNKTFREAQKVLVTWLEKGQCNERNSVIFYSLIQICLNHLEKLQSELKECLVTIKAQGILRNKTCCFQPLCLIEEVFRVIEKENIWNNFTRNQIEKMKEMREDIVYFKKSILYGFNEVEDEESSDMNNVIDKDVQTEYVVQKSQTKVDSFTYKLNTINQKFEDPKVNYKNHCENEILKLKSELNRKLGGKNNLISVGENQQKNSDVASQCDLDLDHQTEMHIISLISVFLYDHKDGENIYSICSQLKKCYPTICGKDIENLMRKYPQIFKESNTMKATEENIWTVMEI